LGNPKHEYEHGKEQAGTDDGDAVVDVDRTEVETRLRAVPEAAVRAALVHSEKGGKKRSATASRADEPDGS